MSARFRVIPAYEAKTQGLPGINTGTEDFECLLYDFSTNPPTLIAGDRMEPEDANFYRDLAWVPKLLNDLVEGE